MRRAPLLLLPAFASAWVACAAGPRAAPPGASFAGQPFSVRQSGDGRVAGQVCGEDLSYQRDGAGDEGRLVGFIGSAPSQLAFRREADERVIEGSLGSAAGDAAVELRVSAEALTGRVGFRRFLLQRRGDEYQGELRIAGTDDPTTATVRGAAALWALPPAVASAVLPSLLTCFVAPIGSYGRSPLVVGFGGAAGAQPRGSGSAVTQ